MDTAIDATLFGKVDENKEAAKTAQSEFPAEVHAVHLCEFLATCRCPEKLLLTLPITRVALGAV